MKSQLKNHLLIISVVLFSTISVYAATTVTGALEHPGTLMQWHKVTLTIDGPSSSEDNTPNPFMDYRMIVTFTHPATGTTYVVPGYYAADGNAANTSATSGNKWRAHLSPDFEGTWNYTVSLVQGTDVAVNGGALGCLLLLLKRNLAGLFLQFSLAGVAVQMFHSFFMSNSFEVFGPGGMVMPVMVIIIAVYLVMLAAKAKADHWTL